MAKSETKPDLNKTLEFLYMARYELKESLEFAYVLLKSGLLEKDDGYPSVEHKALDLALIVSYARPFAQIRGYGNVETYRKKALAVLTGDEPKLHKTVMDLRSEEYAHSDAKANDFQVYMGDKFHVFGRITRWPLDKKQVDRLVEMAEKLHKYFVSQSEELEQSLLKGRSE